MNSQQATKAISARSDMGGPFIDFVHCTACHKSHVGSHLFISYSEQYIKQIHFFSNSAITRSQAAFFRGLDSRLYSAQSAMKPKSFLADMHPT